MKTQALILTVIIVVVIIAASASVYYLNKPLTNPTSSIPTSISKESTSSTMTAFKSDTGESFASTQSSTAIFTNSNTCPANQNFEGSCVGNWQAYFWITVNCTCRWNVSYTAPSDVKNVTGNYSGMGYNSTQIFIPAFGVVEVSLCANATKLDSTNTTLYFGNQNTSLPFHPLQVCQAMGI